MSSKKLHEIFWGEIVPKTTGHGMLCDLRRGDTAAGGWDRDGREMKIRRLTWLTDWLTHLGCCGCFVVLLSYMTRRRLTWKWGDPKIEPNCISGDPCERGLRFLFWWHIFLQGLLNEMRRNQRHTCVAASQFYGTVIIRCHAATIYNPCLQLWLWYRFDSVMDCLCGGLPTSTMLTCSWVHIVLCINHSYMELPHIVSIHTFIPFRNHTLLKLESWGRFESRELHISKFSFRYTSSDSSGTKLQ